MTMDFQSAMETFAEAWVAANSKVTPVPDTSTQTQALALTRHCKTPPPPVSTPAATGSSSRDSVERGGSTPPPPRSLTPLDSMVSPPSVKEEIDNIKSTGKSLPVHCIVEAVCTLDEKRILQQMPWRRRTAIETDSYVIIPVGTPFHNIVYTALLRLGYSADSAAAARGSLVIKNWKALTFDQITEDPLVTVGDILGELTTVATLRIQVFRGRPSVYAEIKDKLLRFLLMQSHNLLASTGCPLDELTISYLYRGTNNIHVPEVSEECRRKFDQWWSAQLNPQSPGRSQVPPQCTTTYTGASQTSKNIDRVLTDPTHPAMQTVHSQFPAQKTRMRTSFDPELELPKLQRWFADNQHPSRQQIQQYVRELNSLESRRGRKPLDVNNVVYWFKNARAAQKRAEVRNLTPGLSCHIGMNGYGGHSPSNGSSFLMSDSYLNSERLNEHRLKNNINLCRRPPHIGHLSDEFSNAGSEIDDDDMVDIQPSSPTGPLSLTTSRKDESHNGSPQTSPINPLNIKTETKDDAKCDDDGDSHRINNNNKTMNGSDVEEDEPDNEAETKSNFDVVDQAPSFRPISQRLSISPDMETQMLSRPPSSGGLERLAASFPLVPNSMFSHSIMYMSQYIPGLSHTTASPTGSAALGMSALTADERRKRNRTFIDPVTEVPRLEQWFSLNTHPSHNLILKYTEELNCMAYRQKFPRLEPKNVQFWFKNRRAKCKRLKMSLFDNQASGPYHHGDKE